MGARQSFRSLRQPEDAMSQLENARNQIADEFTTVLNEAEDLLKKAGQETGDKARDIRALAENKLLTA